MICFPRFLCQTGFQNGFSVFWLQPKGFCVSDLLNFRIKLPTNKFYKRYVGFAVFLLLGCSRDAVTCSQDAAGMQRDAVVCSQDAAGMQPGCCYMQPGCSRDAAGMQCFAAEMQCFAAGMQPGCSGMQLGNIREGISGTLQNLVFLCSPGTSLARGGGA